jgi:hypothetical protein
MDCAEFKSSIQRLKNQFNKTPGLVWRKPALNPKLNPMDNSMMGWLSTLVVTFEASSDFIRLRENFRLSGSDFVRHFFSYHYGPYEAHWNLEKVECKKVVVRIDGVSYFGKGYHIHDGAKDKRIFQSELKAPDLSAFTMDRFVESILKVRYGKTVSEAFGLEMK